MKTADVSAETQCKVTLFEPYFTEASAVIMQNNKINETIPTLKITFKWTWNNAPTTNYVTPTLAITGGGEIGREGTITRDRSGKNNNFTYTITMKDVVISNADEDANVTISYNSVSRSFSKTINVKDLISNPTVTLTSN